ncbi:MAG: hypothetical protein EBT62_09680, partial [Opitutaceae bacterium]|nr:hypothetical protein [Opitutaceae bacterium]
EALQGTENQIAWATNAILPGVLDGMKAAGLKRQPPVVIRTHAMNPEAIMPPTDLNHRSARLRSGF